MDNQSLAIKCPNCGNINSGSASVCTKCGNNLKEDVTVDENVNTNEFITNNSSINNSSTSNTNKGNEISEILMTSGKYILGAFLKPFDKFKENEEKFSDIKNAGILSGIIVAVLTIISIISSMFSAVRVTNLWTGKTEWVFENLKHINYFKVFFRSALIYAGIIVAIAGIYYLATLIIKKQTSFPKLLAAATTSFVPVALATSILAPILSLIASSLSICVVVIGFIYTLAILVTLVNYLIPIDNQNIKIYFHSACLSVFFIVGGYIVYNIVLKSVTSTFSSLL